MEMHDGTNEQEVYQEMGRRGFFHSPIPDPQVFALGILSTQEAVTVRTALGDRTIKARLMDVVNGEDGAPVMRLRGLDGSSIEERPIPAGSSLPTLPLVAANLAQPAFATDDGALAHTRSMIL